jgi:hypothetical protein
MEPSSAHAVKRGFASPSQPRMVRAGRVGSFFGAALAMGRERD